MPGTPPSSALVKSLADAAGRECRPLDHIEGELPWRHEMVPVLVKRALERVVAED